MGPVKVSSVLWLCLWSMCVAVGDCVLCQQLLLVNVFVNTAILELSDVGVCLSCVADLPLKCKQGVFCCCWLSLPSSGSYKIDSES